MVRLLFIFFLLIPSLIQAQDNKEQKNKREQRLKDSLAIFGPSEKGIPNGVAVSAVIGKNGGHLVSADKKAELIIPPGALTTETLITIQPVTNTNKAGFGTTYHFEPSGIQFQQAVQLVFHYTGKDIEGNSPEQLSMSTQNEQGSWLRLSDIKVDTVAKTITGSTMHFSGYVMSWSLIIYPAGYSVKVGKQIEIRCFLTPTDNTPREKVTAEQTRAGYVMWFDLQFQNEKKWSVNGVVNGNATVGTIFPPPIQASAWEDRFSMTYEAPLKLPDQNPVKIRLEIKGVEALDGKFYTSETTTSLLVYDDCFEVEMMVQIKGGSRQAWGGKSTYQDDGNIIISLDKKEPELARIFNRAERMDFDNCPKRKILNPQTNSGLFHVSGLKLVKITPANPPTQPYRTIEVMFEPFPIEITRFTFNCPPPPGFKGGRSKGKIDLSTSAPGGPPPLLMFMAMPAMPQYLKFLDKNGEQIIMEMGKPGDDLYMKIWVKKVDTDQW